MRHCIAVLLASHLLALASCSSAPKVLPSGPPPEYETPRDYKPDRNIDASPSPALTSLPSSSPPLPPSSAAPPPPAAPSAATSAKP